LLQSAQSLDLAETFIYKNPPYFSYHKKEVQMARRPNPELVRYIEKHLAKGFKIRHIKKRLKEVGHPVEAIETALDFVLERHPEHRKKLPRFMIIYGIILILGIAAFVWFMWFKASQQIEYTETVKQVEQKTEYMGMTEMQLLKLAASRNDLEPCNFIKDHNTYYACMDKYWARDDCSWEKFIEEGVEDCLQKRAMSEKDPDICFRTENTSGCLYRLADTNSDASLCGGVEGCVIALATARNDENFCNVMEDSIAEEDCVDEVAEASGNKELCITHECEYNLLKTYEEKNAFVLDLKTEFTEEEVEHMVIDFAWEDGDKDMCAFSSSPSLCLAGIAVFNNDTQLCGSLTDIDTSKCISIINDGCSPTTAALCSALELDEVIE
jgi:hypothetical protein